MISSKIIYWIKSFTARMYKKYFQYEAYLLLDNPDKKSIISFVKKLAAFSSVWLFNRSSVVEVDVVVVVVVVEVVVVTDVVVCEAYCFKYWSSTFYFWKFILSGIKDLCENGGKRSGKRLICVKRGFLAQNYLSHN